jgi:hypothetical protein
MCDVWEDGPSYIPFEDRPIDDVRSGDDYPYPFTD